MENKNRKSNILFMYDEDTYNWWLFGEYGNSKEFDREHNLILEGTYMIHHKNFERLAVFIVLKV